ncbi:hypothetical protein [Blastococcus sp. CCUG 61487]|nr:hypothetical protein [Blastococcus sp. CCUG 61487]
MPCVLVIPVADGNPDYLRWVVEETRSPAADGHPRSG